jgi:hypothetical protein
MQRKTKDTDFYKMKLNTKIKCAQSHSRRVSSISILLCAKMIRILCMLLEKLILDKENY